jgi:xanthine dehydrogenase YagS FAD-binding subunit
MIMTMPSFSYVRPQSLRETFRHLSTGDARLHAGGTDLLGCLRDGVFGAEKVVSISRIEELKGVRQLGNGSLRIGALATVSEVAGHPLLAERYPALVQAAREVASPQLRNQGTIGGNLCQKPRCWYYRGDFHCSRKGGSQCFAVAGENQYHCILGGEGCYIVHPSDIAPALVAYEARVEIAGAKGSRTVPVEKLYVLPGQEITRETILKAGEVVTAVLLPRPPEGLRSSYRKVRARGSWDFALAGVALALRLSGGKVAGARIVLAGAAPVPWRSPEAEEALAGRPLDEATVARAAAAAMKAARPLEHNGYKIDLFKGLLAEELAASNPP